MQKPPEVTGRKMIPRWRGLHLTPSMELASVRTPQPRSFRPGQVSEQVLHEWQQSPSPWSALDVVAMALVEGRSVDSDRANALLKTMMDKLTPGARHLIISYETPQIGPRAPSALPLPPEVRWRHIAELKAEIRAYPRNAILYVDLARAHVSLGQVGPARRALEIALALAPASRYVIRCAVRFFVFEGELDRAWQVLRDVPRDDPWLSACRVSVADLSDRPQESLRTARQTIDKGSPGQITELAAAVATVELQSGANKLAKKLFRRGAENPSDNTVAQIRWAHETAGIPFDQRLLDTDLSFEARTGQAIEEQDWHSATHHASVWLGDEPFSTRAASLGAFIAAEMLQDFERAEGIASRGILVNPHDAVLLNNRAYCRACLGDIAGARADIKLARNLPLSESDEICLIATEGCVEYRSGDPALGAILYKSAIDKGISGNGKEYSQRALIHWISEDGLLGRRIPKCDADSIIQFFADTKRTTKETRAIFSIYALPFLTGSTSTMEKSDLTGASAPILNAL